jgi:hypothetical protein
MLPAVLAVVAAAAVTCAGALVIGQVACRLCGSQAFTFAAAPVGLALLLLISVTAIHVPGHTTTVAVVLGVIALGCLAWLVARPAPGLRWTEIVAVAPVAFLALLPFLASGRAGTLGVSFDNDMATHLRWAEAIASHTVAGAFGLDPSYPVGPHALVAVLATGGGTRVDYAFAGVTMAVPILTAWTALIGFRGVAWLAKALGVMLVSISFLLAGYYAQGSFKELMQALFVLAFPLVLEEMRDGRIVGRLRWVPAALVVGGSLSCYSVGGLPWFLAILGLAGVVLGGRWMFSSGRLREGLAAARPHVTSMMVALVVLLVLLIPQLPRIVKFYESNIGTGGGTGIPTSSLGNLAGPVEFWKVFGVWDGADYRLPAGDPLLAGAIAGCILIAALVGVAWWVRRRGPIVPIATAAATAIWIYSDRVQSPYVAAKALVVAAPLIMLVTSRWLVTLRPRESWLSSPGLLRLAVVALFGWAAITSSVRVLRAAYVGPTAHVDDLRSLRPLVAGSHTLFIGWDDFIGWELYGTPVDQPYLGYLHFALNPEKAWQPGQPLDFDDIPAEVLDRYRFVVAPRDPAASQPPSNVRLIRSSRYYDVWERVGPTPQRLTLAEGSEPGAILNCATPAGRAISRIKGIAALREPDVVAGVPILGPGSRTQVRMSLHAGRWLLSSPYTSPNPIAVDAPGLHSVLPANLDRPGNRWPIGETTIVSSGPTTITVSVQGRALAGPLPTFMNTLEATPVAPERIVALSRACGRYVDWYQRG